MLELKKDYLHVTAKRDEIHPDWINARIEITARKPIELLKNDVFEMEWLMYTAFKEFFGNQDYAEKAMIIFADGDKVIRTYPNELPIIREYPLNIDDISREDEIEKELMVSALMHREKCGFLTEETMLLVEAIRFIRKNLPYIDFWQVDDSAFPTWDDEDIWSCHTSKKTCHNCEKCEHCSHIF
ncbi:MAG: hypothetical protein IKF38_03540 [Clostridia bacterium]|nr:hypothetical protein [Clostridia bacterium]